MKYIITFAFGVVTGMIIWIWTGQIQMPPNLNGPPPTNLDKAQQLIDNEFSRKSGVYSGW